MIVPDMDFLLTILNTIHVYIALIHITALTLLILASVRIVRNLLFLKRAKQPARTQQTFPRVSVLIPARNEEANIKNCITSLIQQDYPDLEILVLDDQSTDNTWSHLEQMKKLHSSIRALKGDHPPPPGWNGKSYACHRLAEQATGDWLLFTDADTHHTPYQCVTGDGTCYAP